MLTLHADAVLFDLDGVLVDSWSQIVRLLRNWAVLHGLDVSRVVAAARGRTDHELVAEMAPFLDVDTEVARLTAWEVADFTACRAMEGARETLDAIPPGWWGIVTSGMREAAEGRLRAAGLPVPDVLVCAEDVALGKPAPMPYLTGAERLGIAPGSCVVVEDAPAGVASGRAAGMKVIGVTGSNPHASLAADVSVTSLALLTVEARVGTPRLAIRVTTGEPGA